MIYFHFDNRNSLRAKRLEFDNGDDLGVQPIKCAMSRERYQVILSNLHLNDNAKMDSDKKDKLYKVRPILDHLNQRFSQNRSLSEHLCVDESMIKFKGRSK